jgi:imipenem/basic amino acid-specific outer membrane pore
MKIVKMSLIAAVLVGSSAFAISNVKVSGDAKLYYNTNDAQRTDGTSGSLFSAQNSAGQTALGLGVTADLLKHVSAGAHLTALSTLGLQGQLVNNVWEGTNGLTDSYWFDEAWLAGTFGKTTVKAGRMKLDTPLVFSETWSIATNTFEGAVVINQDIPDTTLVGAYVGGSNADSGVNNMTGGHGNGSPAVGIANRIQNEKSGSSFSQFYNGAYAVGAINNSWKPLTAQAWYYDAPQYLNAWWLQADVSMMGIMAGAQYTGINYDLNAVTPKDQSDNNNAYALMLGYKMKGLFTAKVAFSQTGKSKTGYGAGQNLATIGNAAQSKLYTEAWWNYGYVTRANTDAFNITLTSPVADLFDLGLYYTHTSTSGYTKDGNVYAVSDAVGKGNGVMNEFTITAGKKFGPLDTTLAYIYTKAGDQNIKNTGDAGSSYNSIQAYLTLNF